jgi:hypothetical protein
MELSKYGATDLLRVSFPFPLINSENAKNVKINLRTALKLAGNAEISIKVINFIGAN